MKKVVFFFIAVIFFLLPSSVDAAKQVFVNGSGNDLNNATTEFNGVSYSGFGNSLTWSGTENIRNSVIPTAGTFRNLVVELTGTPGTGNSYAFALRVNGSTSILTTTISDSETSDSDQANEVSVSAGDIVSIRVVPSSSPAVRDATWSFEFEPSIDNESVSMGHAGSVSTGSTSYMLPNVRGNAETPETSKRLLVPLDGTIKALYVDMNTAPGAGNQWTFAIFKNGSQEASSVVTVSDTETADNVTGLSIDIVPGDSFSIEIIPTSAPASLGNVRVSVLFSSDTNGESIIGGTTIDNLSTGATEYNHFTGGHAVTWTGGESDRISLAGITGFNLNNFRVELIDGSPGAGGDAYQFTVRKDSGAGNGTCTITDAETTCTDGVNTDDFVSGNELTIEVTPAVTPTTRDVRWSVIQFIEAAAPAPTSATSTSQVIDWF